MMISSSGGDGELLMPASSSVVVVVVGQSRLDTKVMIGAIVVLCILDSGSSSGSGRHCVL